MYYAIGVNLGFDSTLTAITVAGVEEAEVDAKDRAVYSSRKVRKFDIPWLEELPQGTDYGSLIDTIHTIMSQDKLHNNSSVLLNCETTGPAIFTMFQKAGIKPLIVNVKQGSDVTEHAAGFNVPLSHIISSLHIAFSMGRIDIADIETESGLQVTERFLKELENFKMIKGSFENAANQIQNQMVISAALTIWWLEQYAPVKLPTKINEPSDWDWQRGA